MHSSRPGEPVVGNGLFLDGFYSMSIMLSAEQVV